MEFCTRYAEIEQGKYVNERIPKKHCEGNTWLVKPAAANQGKGIEFFSKLTDILSFVASKSTHNYWVVQKYIERPLLYYGRKFDIRIWALFTADDECYLFKRGYLRTSSDDYDLAAKDNYIHLTNNCLQKNGENYGTHEDGNTIGFEKF